MMLEVNESTILLQGSGFLIIKKAMFEDLESVCNIDCIVLGNKSRKGYLVKSIENETCLVAIIDGSTAGFAIFDTSFFGHCFISLVIVNPLYRRRGIARGLIEYIQKICPSEKLFTSTNESNKVMQKVCDSLGYVKSGVIENLDEGDPEIIYFKRIR
jgi:ribosomal protein S18 acetylase RimI-like enzyme